LNATDVTMAEQGGTGGVGQRKVLLFLAVLGGVLLVDVATKLAVERTMGAYDQIDIIGEYVRLTFIYNPGAAFGIKVGESSRQVFMGLSVIALMALLAMYWFTPASDRVRLAAIALICGGAIGNLIDRVRSHRGVIDFLDVGVGDTRWPVFNVADIAVTAGAIILALSLWKEEQHVGRGG
jgi:signal peptidase II